MLPYIIGITTLSSVRPYFRKHILDTLDPHDLLFIQAVTISIFVLLYFAYVYFADYHKIKETYNNCCKLSNTQIIALTVMSMLTVFSSLLIFNIEKHYNTPFVNNILLKGASIVLLLLVSIFIFNESYSVAHTVGIILTIAGIFTLMINAKEA